NSQIKDNKIDLLGQQYEQFTILEKESTDSGFARFNTIITSLKALDEGFSSKNYVRKFLRAIHPKWRTKVTAIEELKDLSSLALRRVDLQSKTKKKSSDDETSTSRSDDEEYVMVDEKKEKSDRNALDTVIQIISLAIVQSLLATKIKRPLLEVLGAIAKMKPRTKPMMKLVSWLNCQMR
ncbi:hypothetical protein Tco_1273230, partial [Tanacetum coccineum]